MEEANAARAKVIKRILDLAEITVPRGSSEAEEATAMRLAQRLIAKYNITIIECAEAERVRALEAGPRIHRQPPPAPPSPAPQPMNANHYGFAYGYATNSGQVFIRFG